MGVLRANCIVIPRIPESHTLLNNPASFFRFTLSKLSSSLSKEFQTFEFALMKTFAMTLGELDYENDFILAKTKPHYPGAVNVVFVLFVLAMPIILMNMLV